MSEGYICDRCGSTHGGSPDAMLLLGDGRSRDRPGIAGDQHFTERGGPLDRIADVEFGLCLACRNDFRAWWRGGGGDPTEVARDDD